jgi:hypothetical protein
VCNSADDDCDGIVDEDFDLRTDADHCGACGRRCRSEDARMLCVDAECVFAGCPEGRADRDGDEANGCEAECARTPGPEACNGGDDDCDGRVDEDFDLASDLAHCGACGAACALTDAEATCLASRCEVLRCAPGRGNLDGVAANGCEAACTPGRPGPEVCDLEDNDCDGSVDEGFDRGIDPENCGACGVRCGFANAGARCVDAVCALATCEPGFANADGVDANGCEARCLVSGEGVEQCDEIDNDCNGVVDDGFDKSSDVENCGGCSALEARYRCAACGADIREAAKPRMLARGAWRATAPGADPSVAGFHINALYCPVGWLSWAGIAAKAEAAATPEDKYRILRDTWLLECVQEDTTNPQPCSKEDTEAYPHGQMPVVVDPNAAPAASEEDLMKDFE